MYEDIKRKAHFLFLFQRQMAKYILEIGTCHLHMFEKSWGRQQGHKGVVKVIPLSVFCCWVLKLMQSSKINLVILTVNNCAFQLQGN